MTTNYKRGYNFERRVRLFLEDLGFYVIRSAGSHGVADLVAFQRDSGRPPLFIQCKRHGQISKGEKQKLFDTAETVHAWPMLCHRGEKNNLVFTILDTLDDEHEVVLD